MKKKHTFREPLGKDKNGLYITAAQMQFFLNRRDGGKSFIMGDSLFFNYFYKCAVYNIIWDLMEKHPNCATIFWDDTDESLGVKFPEEGIVVDALKNKKIQHFFEGDEDERVF